MQCIELGPSQYQSVAIVRIMRIPQGLLAGWDVAHSSCEPVPAHFPFHCCRQYSGKGWTFTFFASEFPASQAAKGFCYLSLFVHRSSLGTGMHGLHSLVCHTCITHNHCPLGASERDAVCLFKEKCGISAAAKKTMLLQEKNEDACATKLKRSSA